MTPNRPDSSRPGNDNAVPEEALQAYVDGQLDSRHRAAIEAYLAGRPDEAARLAAYRKQNIGLHALFDSASARGGDGEPAPQLTALAAQLDAQLHTTTTRKRRRPVILRRLAASVVVMLSAGTAGWLALDQVTGGSDALVNLTRQAAEAPLQTAGTTPAAVAPAGERQVVAWLAAQPGDVPTTVPDLEALGFRLSGERLVTTADGRPAAQLLYSDEAGQRVTLTMRSGGKAGQTSFTFARDGEAARFFWQDAHMAYSLTGAMAQEKLLQIAEAVSASLRDEAEALPEQESVEAEPKTTQTPAADPAPASPAPGEPVPSLENIPLIPVPAAAADNLPKET
jgi:anti-sigma factor RsiW